MVNQFAGRLPDAEVARMFERCGAFILPGMEDFGLTPLEANAAGRPVVAFGAGGALDTIRDGETGVLFHEETADALGNALAVVRGRSWNAGALRAHAEGFAEPVFVAKLRAVIDAAVAEHARLA